jgi:ATP-dependent DNA helicase RecG
MVVQLSDKLRSVIGSKAKKLADHLDLHTVEDLIRHYPRRYARRGDLTDLSKLRLDEHVTIMATVRSAVNKSYGGNQHRRNRLNVRTEIVVTDDTGELLLTFFRQPYLTD